MDKSQETVAYFERAVELIGTSGDTGRATPRRLQPRPNSPRVGQGAVRIAPLQPGACKPAPGAQSMTFLIKIKDTSTILRSYFAQLDSFPSFAFQQLD